MARATPNAEDLNEHLSKLPQEIYDDIYDLVLAVVPAVEKIKKSYKLPVQLQISRAVRAKFAASYFGGATIFLLREGACQRSYDLLGANLSEACAEWVEALDHTYRAIQHRWTIPTKEIFLGSTFAPRERYYIAHVTKKVMGLKLGQCGLSGDLRVEANMRHRRSYMKIAYEPAGLDRQVALKRYF